MYKRRTRRSFAKKRHVKRRGLRRPRRFSRKARMGGNRLARQPFTTDSLKVTLPYPFTYNGYFDETSTGDQTTILTPGQIMYSGNSYPNCMGLNPTTGIGGQPILEVPVGFAQYSQYYAKWRCYGSRIHLRVINLGDTNTSGTPASMLPVNIGLFAAPYDGTDTDFHDEEPSSYNNVGNAVWNGGTTDATPPGGIAAFGALDYYLGTTYKDLLNEPFIKWKVLHPPGDPRSEVRLSSHRSTHKMCNVKFIKDNTDFDNISAGTGFAYSGIGDYAPSAARGFAWIIKVAPAAGTNNVTNLMITGKIFYHIEFFDRINISNPPIVGATP